MRLRAIFFACVAVGGTGVAAYEIAGEASAYFERRTAAEVTAALGVAGQDWARAEVDGIDVTLTGLAPDETALFRAHEVVRQIISAGRITDLTTARTAEPGAAPDFALELMRNEAEVSLIGLVPDGVEGARGDAVIRQGLARAGLDAGITDMLESAAHPEPEGWAESRDFALGVLADLPRAKISVTPGRVEVTAVTTSAEARDALETKLRNATPEAVALSLDITAPRPVIAPFAAAFTLTDGVGVLETCTAESAEGAEVILAAARETGAEEATACEIGLGAPGPDWAAVVVRGIGAVREMGGGRFALSDFAAELRAPAGVGADQLDVITAGVEADLPEEYALSVVSDVDAADEAAAVATAEAAVFRATLLDDGVVRLAGSVRDATSRQAIASYAAALFGHDRVMDTTLIDPDLPDGWPGRVLAGVEALSQLEEGEMEVTAETVAVEGWGLVEDVDAQVEALLAEKLEGGSTVEVRYDAEKAELATRTPPELCAAAIEAILDERQIAFGAGESVIAEASRGVIAAIGDVLAGCPGARFEVAGHTDAQGRNEVNLRISEARAGAVVEALEPIAPLVVLTARGLGAAEPIADNGTPEGRARNRRIAFTLKGVAGDAADLAQIAAREAGMSPGAARAGDVPGGDENTLAGADWPRAERPRAREASEEEAHDESE